MITKTPNQVLVLLPFICLLAATVADARPKYGNDAMPLSAASNQEYFRKNPAHDFWRLIPYYLPQETGRGCSAANLAMILNAARARLPLTSDDELVTFKSFIEKFAGDENYQKAIEGKTITTGTNFANSNLARVLKNAADKLKLLEPKSEVRFVEVDQAKLAAGRKAFHAALAENEKSADDFIFFSFIQGGVTGDPEGGAHVATVGAYDRKKNLVLVLDPDRQWYEPYWVSADKLFDAISDPRSDSEKRVGWIHFKVR